MSQRKAASALDLVAATEVAAAHAEAARVGDALAHAAYARLVIESDRLYRLITSGSRPIKVCFSRCPRPYNSATEMIRSVRRERLLEVSTAARERDRLHPTMSCEMGGTYDRFRAVHDVVGHCCLGVGFDRQSEYAAWRFQERFHSRLAGLALATELHGEHSVRWTTGDLPEHKAALLDERLIRRSRVGRRWDSAQPGRCISS